MKLYSVYRNQLLDFSSLITTLIAKSSASALSEDDMNLFYNSLDSLHEDFSLISFSDMLH